MRREYLVSLLAIGAMAFTACGSSSSAPDANTACTTLSGAVNQKLAQCLGTPSDQVAGFAANTAAFCKLVSSASGSKITYDGGKVGGCQSDIQAMTCGQILYWAFSGFYSPATGDIVPPSANCSGVFKGKSTTACSSSDECVSGLCSLQACPGTCITTITADAGDCTNTGVCVYPDICSPDPTDPTGTKQKCAAPAHAGQPCGAAGCDFDSFCDTTTMCVAVKTSGSCTPGNFECAPGYACAGATPTCAKLVAVGGTCTPASSTSEEQCGNGTYCGTSGKCVENGGVGATCGTLSNGENAGCVNSWCDASQTTGMGMCVANVAAAGSCATSANGNTPSCVAGYQCGPANTCIAGTCY
jgi:hypothetical protein